MSAHIVEFKALSLQAYGSGSVNTDEAQDDGRQRDGRWLTKKIIVLIHEENSLANIKASRYIEAFKTAQLPTDDGRSAIWFASLKGKADVVEFLLLETKEKDNVNKLYGQIGSTALHVAAERGHYTVVSTLLRYGVDVFLFQKNFARINLSDMILQNITNEVKKLKLPFGVTIMDCELCHAEAEGHHHVLRGLRENKIKLYAFDICVRESNVLDDWSDTYQKRSFFLRKISRGGVDQSEGNILSFEKKFSIYWNFRDRTVVDAENKPFIDALKRFVKKNFPCEGFVLKKWNAKYRFSDPVMELRNTDMVKFKLEHTDAYVTRVGLKRREVNNVSETVLYDVIVASREAGEGICIATVDLDEVRSSTANSRNAVRQSGAFAVASVKFDVRLKRRDNLTLYVQFVRIVDSDAALDFVPINFQPVNLRR